jgi:hypothetical protein
VRDLRLNRRRHRRESDGNDRAGASAAVGEAGVARPAAELGKVGSAHEVRERGVLGEE